MEEKDYPALYRAADIASINTQNKYLMSVKVYSILLIIATGLTLFGLKDAWINILAALSILGSILVSLFCMLYSNYEEIWYRSRAVAESVKTSTWRFMMQADPFNTHDVQIVKSQFRDRLKNILNEHRDLAHDFGGDISLEEQITDTMCNNREMSLEDRLRYYKKFRIEEQMSWYAKKSEYNKKQGRRWFQILVFCQIMAIFFVLLRIANPSWGYWPSEVFVVCAGLALTWIQVKRFRELASAYGFTAHELGFIRESSDVVKSEEGFAQFVIDSESAFSREHTQWLARKDVL